MLDDQQVRQLLALVMAYDNRRPGDATIRAWSEAARRGRWTYDEATEAIHAHYATETTWLMPGHVTQRIRAARPPVTMSAEPTPAPDQIGQRRVAEIIRGGFSDVDDEPAAPPVLPPPELAVACPHCQAAPGTHCTRPGRSGPVPMQRPHPARREAVTAS